MYVVIQAQFTFIIQINVDVVSLGEIEANMEKLTHFIDSINGDVASAEETLSHIIIVPPGLLPSDVISNSPLSSGAVSSTAGLMNAGANDEEGDAMMMMAVRASIEDERARLAAIARDPVEVAQPVVDDDDLLQQALLLSMGSGVNVEPEVNSTMTVDEQPTPVEASQPIDQQESQPRSRPAIDSDFVDSLLSSVDGIDVNDPLIQAALAQLNDSSKKSEEKKDSK